MRVTLVKITSDNEPPRSPAQTGSPLRSDKLRGIKTKQYNPENCGELTSVRGISCPLSLWRNSGLVLWLINNRSGST
ncbi:MAG: hypothetical protein JRJ45_02045 [Deltaproteobacteria bacterium]|nr:hypothetical protein [Deltaproteobacteria bacterium]